MATVKTVEGLQIAAAKIASRAARDSKYRKTFLANPVAALKAAGIGPIATRELINEDAYLRANFGGEAPAGADWCICNSSAGCCITCWIASGGVSKPIEHPVDFGAPDLALKPTKDRDQLLNNLIKYGHISSSTPKGKS